MIKYLYIVSILSCSMLLAQNHVIKIEDDNHQPIPLTDVNVIFLGEHTGEEQHLHTDTTGQIEISIDERAMLDIHSNFHQDTVVYIDGTHDYTITLHDEAVIGTETVITAQYKHTTVDQAIHKIRVIDAAEIEQRAAVNLKDVLATEMNIRPTQDNILGSGLTMQGLDGENVKILIDGVPIIGRNDGTIDLSQINLDNIERIEIVEGPLSVSYGTNALAGTINLITKKSTSDKLKLKLNSYYESVGQYNFSGRVAKKFGNHSFSLNGGRNYFQGYSEDPSVRNLTWKPREQYFGTFQYKTSYKNIYLRLNNDQFKEKITNRGAPANYRAFDEYYHTLRNNSSIFFKWYINDNWTYFNTLNYSYYQRKKLNYRKDLVTLEETLTAPENQDTSIFDLIMTRGTITRNDDSSKINYQFGYDVQVESSLGKKIEENTQSIGDYALFATAEYQPTNRITIRPGIRVAYNTKYDVPVIPSFNVRYALNSKSTLRLSYGRGFRAPSLKELYLNFVDINHNIQGNDNLDAETTDAYQIHFTHKDSLFKVPIKIDISGFYNDLKNKIDLYLVDEDNQGYNYINIGVFKSIGTQASVNLKVKSWTFNAGANYTGRYNQITEDTSLANFLYSPEVQGTVTKEFSKQKFSISFYIKHTGKLSTYVAGENEGDIVLREMEPYTMSNLTVSKTLFKDKLKLSTGVKNLFDVNNVRTTNGSSGAHSSGGSQAIGWGRTIFFSLNYSL